MRDLVTTNYTKEMIVLNLLNTIEKLGDISNDDIKKIAEDYKVDIKRIKHIDQELHGIEDVLYKTVLNLMGITEMSLSVQVVEEIWHRFICLCSQNMKSIDVYNYLYSVINGEME
ncbi:hypothetical protein EEL31_09070 [Brevibacillus laterosporus]|nr:hypothetical protein [Brevibacillus laterosporus]TPG68659.1 hypothetical protein EEL31_09070 [Brevibacillus laterosporus]